MQTVNGSDSQEPKNLLREIIMSITRYGTNDRMSQAVVHGDTVYLSGQVADDTSQGVAGQTAQILALSLIHI